MLIMIMINKMGILIKVMDKIMGDKLIQRYHVVGMEKLVIEIYQVHRNLDYILIYYKLIISKIINFLKFNKN